MPIERAIVIALMRKAFAKGQSRTSFYNEMKAKGLSYRKTTMLADWRSEFNIKEKEGLMRFVRRDRRPTGIAIAKDWRALSREYMYKVKVQSRISPDEPITERFVNIMHDRLLTRLEIEQLGWEMIGEQSPKEISKVVAVTAFETIQRVLE